jgi:hypothetical protein
MTRWTKDGKLDLGRLGKIHVLDATDNAGRMEFWFEVEVDHQSRSWRTEAAARRAAVSWLRRALKQAAGRLEVK